MNLTPQSSSHTPLHSSHHQWPNTELRRRLPACLHWITWPTEFTSPRPPPRLPPLRWASWIGFPGSHHRRQHLPHIFRSRPLEPPPQWWRERDVTANAPHLTPGKLSSGAMAKATPMAAIVSSHVRHHQLLLHISFPPLSQSSAFSSPMLENNIRKHCCRSDDRSWCPVMEMAMWSWRRWPRSCLCMRFTGRGVCARSGALWRGTAPFWSSTPPLRCLSPMSLFTGSWDATKWCWSRTPNVARLVLYDMALKSWETLNVGKDWICS